MNLTTLDGAAIVALAIAAHAWAGRMQGPPVAMSVIGWVVNVLALIAIAVLWVR